MRNDTKTELKRLRSLISDKAKDAKKKRLKRVRNSLKAEQSTA